MNILHLVGDRQLPPDPEQADISGVVRVALELARAQADMGYQATVARIGRENWQSSWKGIRLLGLKGVPWARWQVGQTTLDFRQHLPYMLLTLRSRFDIVHGHLYSYMRFLRARARVVHIHGDPYYRGSRNEGIDLKPLDLQCIARYSDRQIAISQFVADELQRGFGSAGHVVTVHNGIEASHFARERWQAEGQRLRESWQVAQDTVVFLFAGAIVAEKGMIHLARAFTRLAEQRPDVHLAIAGSSELWGGALSEQGIHSEYERGVKQVLQPLYSAGRVHFLGKVPAARMPAVYHASDVLVVPSVWREGFGLVSLEGLASGRPVIASQTGGLVEVVNEQCGMLVPPADEEALEQAMGVLASDPAQRAQLGEAARQRAQLFSWTAAAQRLDTLYRELLAG